MSTTIQITESELKRKVAKAIDRLTTADDSADASDDGDYESVAAYGTGVQPTPKKLELTGDAEASANAKRAHEDLMARQNQDRADYCTGVEARADPAERAARVRESGADLAELTADARGSEPDPLSVPGSDLPGEAYGTGIEGDTSRQEYLKQKARREQAELIADALNESDEE